MYLSREEIYITDTGTVEYCFLDRKLGQELINKLKHDNKYFMINDVFIIFLEKKFYLFIRRKIIYEFFDTFSFDEYTCSSFVKWSYMGEHFMIASENNAIYHHRHVIIRNITDNINIRQYKFHESEKFIKSNTPLCYYLSSSESIYVNHKGAVLKMIDVSDLNKRHEMSKLVYLYADEYIADDDQSIPSCDIPDDNICLSFIKTKQNYYYYYFIYEANDKFIVVVYDHSMKFIEEEEVDRYHSLVGYYTSIMLLVEKDNKLFFLPRLDQTIEFPKNNNHNEYIIIMLDDEISLINKKKLNIREHHCMSSSKKTSSKICWINNDDEFCWKLTNMNSYPNNQTFTQIKDDFFGTYLKFNIKMKDIHINDKDIYLISLENEIYKTTEKNMMLVTKLSRETNISKSDIVNFNKLFINHGSNYSVLIEKDLPIETKIYIIGSRTPEELATIDYYDYGVHMASGYGPSRALVNEIFAFFQTTYLYQTGKYPLFKTKANTSAFAEKYNSRLFLIHLGHTLKWCLYHVRKFPFRLPLRFYVNLMSSPILSQFEKINHWKEQNPLSFDQYINDPETFYPGKSFDQIFNEMFEMDNWYDNLNTMFHHFGKFSIDKEEKYTVKQIELLITDDMNKQLSPDCFLIVNINSDDDDESQENNIIKSLIYTLIHKLISLPVYETNILLQNWTGYPYYIDKLKIFIGDKTHFTTCSKQLCITLDHLKDEDSWPILWLKDDKMID